jgi:hypothetical protein
MTGGHWFLLIAFVVFAVASRYLISRAFPRNAGSLAAARGNTASGVLYSLTGAMLPWKKETARRHLFSYAMGIGYHAGIFLAFLLLVLVFFRVELPGVLASVAAALLVLAGLFGLALLVKRIIIPEMRSLSNPDDYFSNALVTGFLALAALSTIGKVATPWFLIYGGILLLYIPVGKLRHAIYFALARVYLGLFYGRRGVWPAGSDR